MFSWKQNAKDEYRIHGIDLVFEDRSTTTAIRFTNWNERMVTKDLPLYYKSYATVECLNAPTLTFTEENIKQFNTDLSSILCSVSANKKLILMGHTNARVQMTSYGGSKFLLNVDCESRQYSFSFAVLICTLRVLVVVVDPTPPTCCQQSPAPESCGSQQSLPPGGKERLNFVGIRPEVQARKGG